MDGVDLCACKETQSSHIRYTQMLGDNTGVCCLTGEHVATARLHPKRITGAASSAKLITADAFPIGSEMSFKAHAVLKRIIAEDGSRFGTRTLVAWDEHGAPFSFGIEEKESPCSRVTVLVLNEVSRGNIGISYIGQTERRRLSAAYPEILARQRESGLEPVEQLLGRLLESTDIQEQIWN